MKNRIILSLAAVLIVLVLFAVLLLMNFVQVMLNSDVQINLTEVVTQNKDVITSKLKLELNNVNNASKNISAKFSPPLPNTPADMHPLDPDEVMAVVQEFCLENNDQQYFIAVKDGDGSKNGIAYFPNGTTNTVGGRKYYRLASEGINNVSDRLVSRVSGEDIFVISVPLVVGGQIVGTVQRSYSPEEMYKVCSLSLFSDQGSMYIVNSEGYTVISSDKDQEGGNYLRHLVSSGNAGASEELEAAILSKKSGLLEATIEGKQYFSAYTPIEEIHDWYLITSVEVSAVSPNSTTVIRMFYVILVVVVVAFGGIVLYFLSYKNRQQSNLERIAFVDTITQGNTYNKFLVEIGQTLADNSDGEYALLSFDIDNFKYINSYYGFDFGDSVLRKIYDEFCEKLLPGEIAARVSGDHFVALLTDPSEARVRDMLHVRLGEDGNIVYISAGLYRITDRAESVNLMVDKAGTAAQSVKGMLNKQLVVYTETFDQTIAKNEQTKRNIERAIKNREIVPFYQPKVDVYTGTLVGAEALARWKNSDGKIISPAEFIPLCEKTGQIVDVDMAIFTQVLEFLERNISEGNECVPISVNFSRLHLLGKEFIHTILEMLKERSIPANLIQIELTESVFFENSEVIVDFVNHLHIHGLLICIDDFGSGYSSLNMLKDIPVDVLKIDKAFLDESKNAERQHYILSAITMMAERLKMEVVVEGVETNENVLLMKQIGCSVAQGYFFSRPVEESKFEDIFKKGKI